MGQKTKAAGGKAHRETVLAWSGELTIHRMAELRAALLEAFEGSQRVLVDLGGASGGDAALLQLLLSAEREAAAVGKAFRHSERTPEWFRDLVRSCGFTGRQGGSDGSLWPKTSAPME